MCISPSLFDPQTEGLVCLPRCRHHPELLQQTQPVPVAPEFHDLATPEVKDVHANKRYLLPCRRNSHPPYRDVSSVCPTGCPPDDDLIPFRKDVIDSSTEIRNPGAPSRGALFAGFIVTCIYTRARMEEAIRSNNLI